VDHGARDLQEAVSVGYVVLREAVRQDQRHDLADAALVSIRSTASQSMMISSTVATARPGRVCAMCSNRTACRVESRTDWAAVHVVVDLKGVLRAVPDERVESAGNGGSGQCKSPKRSVFRHAAL